MTLTKNQTVKINNKTYTVTEIMDMTKMPNLAKTWPSIYIVAGTRGAAYTLQQTASGYWFLLNEKSRTIWKGAQIAA